VERAVESICAALRFIAAAGLPEHVETEVHAAVSKFLRDLTSHPAVAALLTPRDRGVSKVILHKPGQETKLCFVLEGLAGLLREKSPVALRQEAEEKLARKKNLIENGLLYLHQGQTAKGNAFFKKAVDEFDDDKGLCLHVARLLMKTGQTLPAAKMFERAIQNQPRKPAAYKEAANAWMELREYEKAESVYKAEMLAFGGHPATLGKMAKLYLAWNRLPEAENFASRAIQTDPDQPDALETLEKLGNVFP
jgi:tetratricopeptide (TPR) repeat protein